MAKTTKKNAKRAGSGTRKAKKVDDNKNKVYEYVGNLVELHKLQGVLLRRLYREI